MADRFDDPKIGIHKVYTRKGDGGTTRLVGGQEIAKDDARIEAYGTVDELNAIVGLCREEALGSEADGALARFADKLLRVQHSLFNLGSTLSTLPEDRSDRQPRVRAEDVEWLEQEMDDANAKLPPLTSFVLPGGGRLSALLHLARTVCRRAERHVVALQGEDDTLGEGLRFLNRLSDGFFVWSRWTSTQLGQDEVLWDPNTN